METRKFGIWDNGTATVCHFYGPATGTADKPIVQLLDTETHRFNLAYFEVFDPYKIVVNGELLPSIFELDVLQTKPPYTLTLKRQSGADDLRALPEGIYPLVLAYKEEGMRLEGFCGYKDGKVLKPILDYVATTEGLAWQALYLNDHELPDEGLKFYHDINTPETLRYFGYEVRPCVLVVEGEE